VVLLSLLASACDTVDENGYVIPSKSSISGAELQIAPDGSPLVFAQVGMYYATAAQLDQWQPRYMQRNAQSIAYTPGTGGWQSHSFRNLQPYGGSSFLLRSAKGQIEALVEHLHRHILYAYTGSDWQVKKSILDKDESELNNGFGFGGMGTSLALEGDTAWDIPVVPWNEAYTDYHLKIKRNSGALIDLDTVPQYSVSLMVPGKSFNYLILVNNPVYNDTTTPRKLICYRWSPDPIHPDPRKQVVQLDRLNGYGALFSSEVQGENRVYLQVSQDSLVEFALRNDTLSQLGYRFFPVPVDTVGKNPYRQYPIGSLSVDPSGCIHSLGTSVSNPLFPDSLVMVHSSSCGAAVDSIPMPRPSPSMLSPQLSGLRFAPDGTPMVALILTQNLFDPNSYGQVVPPSWLYFARRGPGGKWTWDLISAY
jgi:hypothetical protein